MTPFPVVAGYTGEALLERDAELAALAGDVRSAAVGDGRAVLVTGEAGIGKTSLVRGFLGGVDGPVLAGACDDLLTPAHVRAAARCRRRPAGPAGRGAAGRAFRGARLVRAVRAAQPTRPAHGRRAKVSRYLGRLPSTATVGGPW